MSTEMTARCYVCHLTRYVNRALALGDEETATAFARDLMELYRTAPAGVSSPWFTPGVADLFDKYYHLGPDRYKKEKEFSNAYVLSRMERIHKRVQTADDPLYAALQFAVLGNYIDFAALQDQVSFEELDKMLETADTIALDKGVYQQLCQDLENGKKLLYLTDNAGEIGFDRIFAEEIQRKYPLLSITFCVRGGPAQNDATREDAAAVGIPFPIIDNGNRIAGTQLDMLSKDAEDAMNAADVIISKGQGNAETLLGSGYNIYYAFLVKCQLFVQLFNKEKLTPMLVRERR